MPNEHVVSAFVITGAWDVILRLFSEKKITFMGIENWKWVRALQPYFQQHTVLAAALIAGFVGAIAYTIIESVPFQKKLNSVQYFTWVAFVSAIVGIPMRYSKLFPHLEKYYYQPLGFKYSMATDGFSGIVVGATMILLSRMVNAKSRIKSDTTRNCTPKTRSAGCDSFATTNTR